MLLFCVLWTTLYHHLTQRKRITPQENSLSRDTLFNSIDFLIITEYNKYLYAE